MCFYVYVKVFCNKKEIFKQFLFLETSFGEINLILVLQKHNTFSFCRASIFRKVHYNLSLSRDIKNYLKPL
jgi:hypothetical protein